MNYNGNENKAETQTVKKSGSGLKVIIIVLALLLVIAVGVIVVLLINNDKDNVSDKNDDEIVTEAEENEEKDLEDENNKEDKNKEEKTDSVFEDLFSKDVEKSELQFFYNKKEGKTYLILNGEVLEDTVDGEISTTSSDYIPSKSLKNEVFFFGNYAVKDKKLYKFADNISMDENKISLNTAYSNDGEGVAYINEVGELMLYQFNNNETIKISDEEVTTFAISPDAKTVLYTIREDGRSTLYLYKDGENEKIDEGFQNRATVIAVSNNGKHCYIYDWRNESEGSPLYHYNGNGDKTVIYIDTNKTKYLDILSISLNIDNTQISGWNHSDNYLFVYDSLKDEKNQYDVKYYDENRPLNLTPLSSYWLYDTKSYRSFLYSDLLYYEAIIFTGVENLNNCYFKMSLSHNYPFYIEHNEIKKFDEIKNHYIIISNENDKILFKDSDKKELYFASLYDNNPNKIADKIVGFGVTPNFNHVFYITEDKELYVINSDGSERKKLDENVSNECYISGFNCVGWFGPRVIGENYIIYGTDNEEVYLCDFKGKKTKIDGAFDFRDLNRAEDVGSLYEKNTFHINYMMVFPNRSFVTYTNNGNLYKIDSNGKTSLLLENVE